MDTTTTLEKFEYHDLLSHAIKAIGQHYFSEQEIVCTDGLKLCFPNQANQDSIYIRLVLPIKEANEVVLEAELIKWEQEQFFSALEYITGKSLSVEILNEITLKIIDHITSACLEHLSKLSQNEAQGQDLILLTAQDYCEQEFTDAPQALEALVKNCHNSFKFAYNFYYENCDVITNIYLYGSNKIAEPIALDSGFKVQIAVYHPDQAETIANEIQENFSLEVCVEDWRGAYKDFRPAVYIFFDCQNYQEIIDWLEQNCDRYSLLVETGNRIEILNQEINPVSNIKEWVESSSDMTFSCAEGEYINPQFSQGIYEIVDNKCLDFNSDFLFRFPYKSPATASAFGGTATIFNVDFEYKHQERTLTIIPILFTFLTLKFTVHYYEELGLLFLVLKEGDADLCDRILSQLIKVN